MDEELQCDHTAEYNLAVKWSGLLTEAAGMDLKIMLNESQTKQCILCREEM